MVLVEINFERSKTVYLMAFFRASKIVLTKVVVLKQDLHFHAGFMAALLQGDFQVRFQKQISRQHFCRVCRDGIWALFAHLPVVKKFHVFALHDLPQVLGWDLCGAKNLKRKVGKAPRNGTKSVKPCSAAKKFVTSTFHSFAPAA